jgi:hypothetical protein
VQRSLPGAAALGACREGEVTTSGHYRHALASSRRSEVCREAEGKGEGSGFFPPFLSGLSDGVRAGSRDGSTAEGSMASSGTPTSTNTYGGGVINSGFDFTKICPPSVRHNARMNLNFENSKSDTVGCQDNS